MKFNNLQLTGTRFEAQDQIGGAIDTKLGLLLTFGFLTQFNSQSELENYLDNYQSRMVICQIKELRKLTKDELVYRGETK